MSRILWHRRVNIIYILIKSQLTQSRDYIWYVLSPYLVINSLLWLFRSDWL